MAEMLPRSGIALNLLAKSLMKSPQALAMIGMIKCCFQPAFPSVSRRVQVAVANLFEWKSSFSLWPLPTKKKSF